MADTEFLKNIYLFNELVPGEISLIENICNEKLFFKDSIIFEEKETLSSLFILKKGSVKVQKRSNADEIIDIATLCLGDHFGEMSLIDNNPTSAQVIAIEDTILIEITARSFSELLKNNSNLALKVYKKFAFSLSKRLRDTDDAVVILKREEDEKRFETLKQAANTVCHYINNPLAAISGLAQLTIMKLDEAEPTEVRKNLESMQEQIKRIEKVISQLVRAVRIVVERVAPGIEMIDLEASEKKT